MPVMMSDVTSPQTKKVIASASIAGQTVGSGNFVGGSTIHSVGAGGGAGFEISVAMRFLQMSFCEL